MNKREPEVREAYTQNLEMIKLSEMSDEEFSRVEMSFSESSLKTLRDTFTDMRLKSMITDKAWGNYSRPFKELKDGRRYFTTE